MKKIFLLFCFIFCVSCGMDSDVCLKYVQDKYKDGEVYMIHYYSFIVIDSEKNIRFIKTNNIINPTISHDRVLKYASEKKNKLIKI